MDNHKLVFPEYLNHYGFLFGGQLLKWVDEIAYIATNIDFPGNDFVTVSMDNVLFRHSVRNGEILRFTTKRKKLGNTSLTYTIEVRREGSDDDDLVLFETNITFVNLDSDGKKQPVLK